MKDGEDLINFFYELGTMRGLPRIHRQFLLTRDDTDNIASHSYRVAMIAWHLAKLEDVDPYKCVMMALLHDVGEIRSGDHNWVHKRYVKIFDEEIKQEQLGDLPFGELKELSDEYDERDSKESIVVKDADRIDQILLLREYEHTGNKEAANWLYSTDGESDYVNAKNIKTESGKRLVKLAYKVSPTEWNQEIYTDKNR